MILARRKFLVGLLAAPMIVRASSLMKVRTIDFPIDETEWIHRPYRGDIVSMLRPGLQVLRDGPIGPQWVDIFDDAGGRLNR
jgi:hypothetical protein